jgi:hypothetical protein
MKKNLASWSPEYLRILYDLELDRLASGELTHKQKEVFTKKTEALYRLGSHQAMKEVWSKLLEKTMVVDRYPVHKGLLVTKNPFNKEQALIGGIHELIWLNSFGGERAIPSKKKQSLEDISKKIKELQKLIKKSGEAYYEDMAVVENILHVKNIEYRNQMGEELKSPSFHSLNFIDGDVNSDLLTTPLGEQIPWMKRSQTQRLGWWTKQALELSLTDILDYYSERMGGYSKIYKDNSGLPQAKLQRDLYVLMKMLYGSPLHEYVNSITSTILNNESLATNKKYSKPKKGV